MPNITELIRGLRNGTYDGALSALYTADERARERAVNVAEQFAAHFPGAYPEAGLFSAPGRTEIGGNHTDHQHGRVLCGAVDVDMLACAAPNGKNVIRVVSDGYPALEVALSDLGPKEEEAGASAALVRGMAAQIAEKGYAPGGVDVYAVSDVPAGAGLSSSAAYEVLIGTILNRFFCGGALDAVTIAKMGQAAESVWFGKPCGLMDQMGSAVGGAVAIDFADPAAPAVRRVGYDFSRSGHALCIIETGSCHADLTGDYAQITREMGAVAAQFGKQVLREVPEELFRAAVPELRKTCGDRAVLRALHFYNDDRRAAEEAAALDAGDFGGFLALVNASGISSALCLQNAWSAGNPAQQAVTLALAVGREKLAGEGAIRVHGGGFAGTVQAFVPEPRLGAFRAGVETLFGPGSCHVLHIRPQGGCTII